MILRICKNCTLCPALLEGLSSHRQDGALPLPYKCSSLPLNTTFIKVCGISYLGPNSVLTYALWFSRKNLTTLRSTWSMGELLQASSPDLQQDGAPDHSTRQEPAPEYLSSSFLYDLVSIWPRISRSQSCTLSDTAISWFLSTVPLFSLSLCLHSELSYFGAEPASFSDYIWIYSHGL